MSQSPIASLRAAIRTLLLADTVFVSALGGPYMYDEAPPGARAPVVTFGDVQCRDWSTLDTRGVEQLFSIVVWSHKRGLSEAIGIAERIVELLSETALTLTDWMLIDLSFVTLITKRTQNGRYARVEVRFRATCEAA